MAKKVARWIADGTNTLFQSEEAVCLAQMRGLIQTALEGAQDRKANMFRELIEGEIGGLIADYRNAIKAHADGSFTVEAGSTGAVKVTRYKAKDGKLFTSKELAENYEVNVMPHIKVLKKKAAALLANKDATAEGELSADKLLEELLDGALGESMEQVFQARQAVADAERAAREAEEEAAQERKRAEKKAARAAQEAITENPDDNGDDEEDEE